jgi:hypothetical protein
VGIEGFRERESTIAADPLFNAARDGHIVRVTEPQESTCLATRTWKFPLALDCDFFVSGSGRPIARLLRRSVKRLHDLNKHPC